MYEIGTGSWYANLSYKNYEDTMTLDQYDRYRYQQCVNRIKFLNLQIGDKITLEYIGGHTKRKYTGTVDFINSAIHLRQNKRTVTFDICLIDTITKHSVRSRDGRVIEFKKKYK